MLSTIYDVVGIVGTVFGIGAAIYSRRAARLSEPTGNGFAAEVISTLNRLERKFDGHTHRDPGAAPSS